MIANTATSLTFQPISLEKRDRVNQALRVSDFRGCEYAFSTMFLWQDVFHTQAAFLGDRLIVRSGEAQHSYLFPPGRGDLKQTILLMEQQAKAEGQPFCMHSVNETAKAELETVFPDRYEFTPRRNDFDYIYEAQSLQTLKGKKLHGKRNHINRFLKAYDGSWVYEPITEQNIDECREMNREWCIQNDCEQDPSKQMEQRAVQQAFDHYFDLHLSGGLIRIHGDVAGFSIGEPLNSDTFLVHIEKALIAYQGIYQMLNQQFSLANTEGFTYINREDDTGSEGLRKAKLSYYPAFLETKYTVRHKEASTV